MILYKLTMKFASPLVASAFNDLEVPFSLGADRLFSWICLGWASIFGADKLKQQIIDPFVSHGLPWIHSDLFPSDDDAIYVPFFEDSAAKASVPMKRLPFFDLCKSNCGLKWGRRPEADDEAEELLQNFPLNLSSTLLGRIRKAELKSENGSSVALLQKSIFPAISSNSPTADGRLQFTALFQLADSDESASQIYLKSLAAVFSFLRDEGFGGMRSIGAGAINKISFTELNEQTDPISDSAKHNEKYLLLSTCCPDENMIQNVEASPLASNSFRITRSSGWIYDSFGKSTDIKKSHSTCFTAGSIFSCKPTGVIVNLSTESHPCYRYGIPFWIAV